MATDSELLQSLDDLTAPQLRRLLAEHLTRQKPGLYWEASAIERDQALNADLVLLRLVPDLSRNLDALKGSPNPVFHPLIRPVETKHDVKDATRKAQHQSKCYGKVLFLTQDATRFEVVEDNGSLGEVVDFDDLARSRQWMRHSAPQY